MKTIADPSSFRENVAKLLMPYLGAARVLEDPWIAPNIEKSIYNFAIREAGTRNVVKSWDNHFFVLLYENRWRCILRNLSTNAQFRADVASGKITPEDLSQMSHIDIDPEHWGQKLETKRKKDLSRFNFDQKASTDMFECRNCRSRRCTYYEMQVRSADESCSYFVTCLDCGKHWRVN